METIQKEAWMFCEKIGAVFIPLRKLKSLFVRDGISLIVKISREEKKFWGVNDLLVNRDLRGKKYACVFLKTAQSGWFCVSDDFEAGKGKSWNQSTRDREYKINGCQLKKEWFFSDIDSFLKMFSRYAGQRDIIVRRSQRTSVF